MRGMMSRQLALVIAVAVVLGSLLPAAAQAPAPGPAQEAAKAAPFKPEEVEQLVAPIFDPERAGNRRREAASDRMMAIE